MGQRGVGQVREGVVRVVEVEGGDEVGHVLAPPGDHLVGRDVVAFGCEPLLDEEDLRVMVAVLGEDVAAARPGRDDVEGQSESGPRIRVAEYAVGVVEPFAGRAGRGVVGCYVVAEAAGFVVGDH